MSKQYANFVSKNLLEDTLSHINNAVTNIFTKIERDDLGWDASAKEKQLVDTFNELVTLEQKIIDILHPMRHEDGELPSPTYLRIEKRGGGFQIEERSEYRQKSIHLYYAKRELEDGELEYQMDY